MTNVRDSDIALADAMLIWAPDEHPELPPLKIVARANDDDDRYCSSWGASNAEFNQTDDAGRLLMLLSKFVELAILERIPAEQIHGALMVIPEYRAILPIDLDPGRH